MIFLDARVDDLSFLGRRFPARDEASERIVAEIIADVEQRGDAALVDSARKFDSPDLTSLLVTAEEIETARVSPELDAALDTAITRVRRFHASQAAVLREPTQWRDGGYQWWLSTDRPANAIATHFKEEPGARVGQRYLALDSAGIYAPGGRAAYPSSIFMNAIPALEARVGSVTVCTPARPDGSLIPAQLVVLRKLGISRVAKVGGAAAIAAMAIGTESVPRVAKIAGPGNRWVNAAKRQLWGRVGLDGYAGPSEVAVVADESSHVEWAAADLITQIEHAPDNVGFLVTWNEEVRQAIADAVERQIENAPRADTLRESAGQSYAILAESRAQAAEILDLIAPEHATLAVENPEEFLGRIRNAGCILLGDYSPESAGDYVAGPSHTLPTSGAARWQNPVSVLDFIKVQSIIRMSEAELRKIGPAAEALAIAEEFPAHGAGISVRWKV